MLFGIMVCNPVRCDVVSVSVVVLEAAQARLGMLVITSEIFDALVKCILQRKTISEKKDLGGNIKIER